MGTTGTMQPLRLNGELTIQTAADWHLALLSAVNDLGDTPGAGLALDLAQVGALDSAGVQLLLSTRRSLAARGQWLQLAASNRGVDDVLDTLGLAELRSAAPMHTPTNESEPEGAPA